MSLEVTPKPLSVMLPTRYRADLLRASLQSLAHQNLERERFEVVVVDDGSTDHTLAVCEEFASTLTLRSFHMQHSGISAAKNLGIFVSTGSILLFFDDDDVAHKDLCRQHLATHLAHPDLHVAVLGFTGWAPSITVARAPASLRISIALPRQSIVSLYTPRATRITSPSNAMSIAC